MSTLPKAPRMSNAASGGTEGLLTTLAHHDAAIQNLGGRMSGVETSVRTLQGEVHSGFKDLGSKLDRLDSAPKFDFHKTVQTVLALAVLFSIVVGGIIWVTITQTQAQFATQALTNQMTRERLDSQRDALKSVHDRLGWLPLVEDERGLR